MPLLSEVTGEASTHSIVACANHTAVRSNRHACNADVVLGNELVAAFILTQIPNAHIAATIAANKLSLVRMYNDIVNRHAMRVVALHITAARIPYLDGAVLGARNQPLRLAVKRDARDVGRVPVKSQDRVRVRRLDVVELHRVVARRRQVPLVGRDAQPVHLRVGVRDRARADAAERFPEAAGRVSVQHRAARARGRYRMVWS